MKPTTDVVPAPAASKPSNSGGALQTQNLRAVKLSPKRLLNVSSFALSDAVMAELWISMASIYGKKWIDQYGEFVYNNSDKVSSVVTIWAEALADVEISRLERALRMCLSRECPFPPTLPEFKAMCARRPWE